MDVRNLGPKVRHLGLCLSPGLAVQPGAMCMHNVLDHQSWFCMLNSMGLWRVGIVQ